MSWPVLAGLLSASLEGELGTFTKSTTTPTADNKDKPWLNLNDGRWYIFIDGYWISRHPIVPGLVVMYEGTEVSIEALDGGEAGAITAVTGAFWQKVSQMDARMPIGPGILPSTLSVAVTNTGGAEKHTLTLAEIPSHSHSWDGPENRLEERGDGANHVWRGTAAATTGAAGGGMAHNNMPPYYGIYFVRRTGRLWYRV
jgi:hypothetical protein